ncbi:uncharacterized protein [Zea mays]|jgi:hypothetical protein|uniref:uncharacterized protein n=1 Tax=Zea mays TaxID=4577 RepID=UPI0016528F9D|nr:uncharacterized protein LOC118476346 [Zea mays]
MEAGRHPSPPPCPTSAAPLRISPPADLALATTVHPSTRDGSSPPCPSHHNHTTPSPAELETSELAVEAMPLGDSAEAADLVLPDKLLAALPRDPYEQLDLARRITALAVSGLEREAGRLRAEATGKDRENAELRERVVLLDIALHETNARLRSPMLTTADLVPSCGHEATAFDDS